MICSVCDREVSDSIVTLSIKTRGKISNHKVCNSNFCINTILREASNEKLYLQWTLKRNSIEAQEISK